MSLPLYLKNLELEISNPCNERCVHCYRTGDETRTGFLSADEVEDILIQTAEFIDSGCHITVTGGEGFLNPQWKDILQVISASGKRFSLFTNGTLLDEEVALFLSSLKNKGLKEVQLSLYALEEEVHDAVTGLKDSCVKTKRALSLLRRYEIPVFISCPVMQINKNSFHHLAAWADANRIPSCCDLMIFDNADYTQKNRSQRLSFKDLEAIFPITMDPQFNLSYIWGKGGYNQTPETTPFYGSVQNGLCIAGDGTVYPMIGWYRKLGNIHTDSLKEIFFNHPLLKEMRTVMAADIEECRSCEVFDFCHFCPTAHLNANQGQLYRLDENYCNYIRTVKSFALRRDALETNKKD